MIEADAFVYIQKKLKPSALLCEITHPHGVPTISVQHLQGRQVTSIQLHPSVLEGCDEQVFKKLDADVADALKAAARESIFRRKVK